jgi:hypothetical protein
MPFKVVLKHFLRYRRKPRKDLKIACFSTETLIVNVVNVKQSLYTPWRRLGGEEV